MAMHAWYDRAPRGVIPSPPRVLFDNPDRDSSGSERNPGGSDSERTLWSYSPPEVVTITPRDERAAEVVPWVRGLLDGERLSLARFTSQDDRESLVMREPSFQLYLRQALQMRLTNLRPAHALYRERQLRILDDFASGLPIGLAVLSGDILRVAATGQNEHMVDMVTGVETWYEARGETMDFISDHGMAHPYVPELMRWLRAAGGEIFGEA